MSAFNRTHQGGAILTFIIVGVVLALAAAGLIYGVQQRGEQARRDAAIAVADRQSDAEQPPAAEPAPQNEPSQDGAPAEPSPQPATPAPAPTAAPSPDQLPTTGPQDEATILFVVVMLTTSITAYITSRRALDRSL